MINQGPKIVTNGLVLCLDAANTKSYPGSGSIWYDLSSNKNDGSLNSTSYIDDKNGCLSFSEAGISKCLTSLQAVTLDVSFTVSSWFMATGYGSDASTANRIVSADRTSGSTKWCVGINSNGLLQVAGAGGIDGELTFSLDYNVINFLTLIVHSTTSYSLFLNNNKLASNQTFSTSVDTNSFGNVAIGSRTVTGDRSFTGRIYAATAYTRQLSDEEVAQNFNALRDRFNI